jgi:ABC-2 type transport system permease protein
MPSPEPRLLGVPPMITEVSNLLRVQLANWRWSWRGMVVLGIAAPTFSMLILSHLIPYRSNGFLTILLIGNLVLVLTFENQSKVAGHFAYMRFNNTLTFFAGLPIRQEVLIVATALSFFILSLPALLVTSVLGAALLNVSLSPDPLLLVVVPMAAMALAGIGATVGSVTRSLEEASALSLLVNLLLVTTGPVVLPEGRVPSPLSEIGFLNPAVYVASALRQALVGPVTGRMVWDLVVMVGSTVIGLAIAGRVLGHKEKL